MSNPQNPSKRKHASLQELHDIKSPETKNTDCLIDIRSPLHYPQPIILNDQQNYAMDCIAQQGFSVFITGAAGTGKSEFVRHLIARLESSGDIVAVTSSKGFSAVQLGGRTIHAFSGLGKVNEEVDVIRKKAKTRYMQDIWNGVDVVIIDDISMLDPEVFRKILMVSQLSRNVKKQHIQWVLVGDFFQQPPVGKRKFKDGDTVDNNAEFCFEIPEWSKIIHKGIVFTQVYRQTDPILIDILNDVRRGAQDRMRYFSILNSRLDVQLPQDGIEPTILMVKPELVNAENDQALRRIKSPEHKYFSQKGYLVGKKIVPYHVPSSNKRLKTEALEIIRNLSVSEQKKHRMLQFLEKNCPAEPILTLKKGAQVILLAELDLAHKLTCGSRGVVLGFTEAAPHYPVVKFAECSLTVRSYMWNLNITNETKIWYSQIPLRLGWAYPIHRLEGQTMDRVSINLKDIFEYGQAYTALSRVRSLDVLKLTHLNFSCIKAHPNVIEYYDGLEKTSEKEFNLWLKKKKSVV